MSLVVHLLGPPLDQNRLNLKLHIIFYLLNNQQASPEMHLQSHFVLTYILNLYAIPYRTLWRYRKKKKKKKNARILLISK